MRRLFRQPGSADEVETMIERGARQPLVAGFAKDVPLKVNSRQP
jgi:hypothetical protein